jgi:hypothetical protein
LQTDALLYKEKKTLLSNVFSCGRNGEI